MRYKFIFLFLVYSFLLVRAVSADDLSACSTLSTNDKFYILTDNLNTTETCITVTANNLQ